MNKSAIFPLITTLICLLARQGSTQEIADSWQRVADGKLGISGMVAVENRGDGVFLLIVHDSKKDPQKPRFALINLQENQSPRYTALKLQLVSDNLPDDLEAIAAIPNLSDTYLALTSAGKLYRIKWLSNTKTVEILDTFNLPQIPDGSDFEGFALQDIDGKIVATWAHRGNSQEPARLYWGTLDESSGQLLLHGSTDISVPFPHQGTVRHISDLKIDSSGIVYISAAADNGNDGPFASAVYGLGNLSLLENSWQFRASNSLFPLYRSDKHKVEAIELIPGDRGGVVLATDDENFGSSVWRNF